MTTSKIVNPNAEVIVFNFRYRLGSSNFVSSNKALDTNEKILLSKSILSIETQKTKANPIGSFNITLAPDYNWISRITVGSWLVILMKNDGSITESERQNATRKTLKMIGRIDSVRQVVDVNQDTGARTTQYIISGRDWGCLLDTTLYLDPIIVRDGIDAAELQPVIATELFVKNITSKLINDTNGSSFFTTSEMFRTLINLWGLYTTSHIVESALNNPLIDPLGLKVSSNPVSLPNELLGYLGLEARMGTFSDRDQTHAFKYIHVIEGPLVTRDTFETIGYAGIDSDDDSTYCDPFFSIINPVSFFNQNTIWQLLVDNSNQLLNETYADIRFIGHSGLTDTPQLTIYKRIKPFILTSQSELKAKPGSPFNNPSIENCISEFNHVKKFIIDKNDVINLNIGNNWADRVNFIQVRCDHPTYVALGMDKQCYGKSCIFDNDSINRDGFKPMIKVSHDLPFVQKNGNHKLANVILDVTTQVTDWKYLLKEWYFNIHTTLNGSISIIGQNDYIEVGDNIVIDSSLFDQSNNVNSRSAFSPFLIGTTLLAHVESVSHTFHSVDGIRSFVTTIRFVRGVIADETGNITYGVVESTLDNDAAIIDTNNKINKNVINTEVK